MNLVKSTGTFGFYTIISRLLGYLRDVLIAIFLGTSFLADAFFVAFRIPNTFRRLFAEGTFNSAFVPSYTSEVVKNKSKSNKFANDVFNLLFLVLFFLVLIIEIFMPIFVGLIAPGFAEDTKKFELATILTRITFPFLLFVSLSSFFQNDAILPMIKSPSTKFPYSSEINNNCKKINDFCRISMNCERNQQLV